MNAVAKIKIPDTPATIWRDYTGHTYLLEKGIKKSKICGALLEGKTTLVCGRKLGEGTTHEGVGFCSLHEGVITDVPRYWNKLTKDLSIPKNIQELFVKVDTLEKPDLFSPANSLKRIAVLYWSVMSNPDQVTAYTKRGKPIGEKVLSRFQLEYLRKLEESTLKVIESERRAEGQGVIKANAVVELLKGFYAILWKTLTKNQARMVITAFGRLAWEHKQDGKIKGDISVLDKEIAKAEATYSEKNEEKKVYLLVGDDSNDE